MRAANVTWKGIGLADVKEMDFTPAEFKTFELQPGDVLVGEASGSRFEVGKSAVWRGEVPGACFQNTLIRARVGDRILPDYLQKHLLYDARRGALADISRGVGIHHLSAKGFAEWKIAVPPLAEQRRISDKLDALLARIDACRERLDRVPGILERFRASVLAAATSGELTAEWREERDRNLASWEQTTVGDLIEGIEAGLNIQCDERPPRAGERGLVKISAVTWGVYDDDESKTLPSGRHIPESTRIQVGDFLISRANTLELVGACVIVHQVSRPVFLSDKILRLVMPNAMKSWLLYVMRSEQGRTQIERLASGNQLSMRNLSQANLRRISVPVPADDERDEIVRRVEALLAYADRLEAHRAAVRARAEHLTPALLAKAFRGELLPQVSGGEPAIALLDGIPSGRAVAPGVKESERGKGRRGSMEDSPRSLRRGIHDGDPSR